MEQSVKQGIFDRLDNLVIEAQKSSEQVQVAKVIQPQLSALAAEYGVDEIDIFVEYMDHLAKKSKHMALMEEEMQVDVDAPDFKLY